MNRAEGLDLGFETAAQILASVGGSGLGVAAFDLTGRSLWRNDVLLETEIARALQAEFAAGVEADGRVRPVADAGADCARRDSQRRGRSGRLARRLVG